MTALTCEQIARAALGEPVKREGAELVWRCTERDRHKNGDAHPSLKVNPQKNVWACFPCGDSGTAWELAARFAHCDPNDKAAVTAWLRAHGLLNGKRLTKTAAESSGLVVATYAYRDGDGNPIARKLRMEPGLNGKKKTFAWQRRENGKWIDGLGSVKTLLYRFPEITREPLVVVTEGEKDADAGAQIGLPTTTSGGTGSFREDHAAALRGKNVVIVADADASGRADAQKRAAMVYGKAVSVKVCEIPCSKDLAEAIEKGVPLKVLLALFEDTLAWKPATGAEILDSVLRFIRRFVSLSESQGRADTLWAAHTHAMDAAECTPYLNVNSAEKQSGKTRLLEVLETLVDKSWLTGRVTAAVLIRKIDAVKPTLLLDESDAAFGGEKEYAEALRGVLNSGYRRGGKASSCVGQGANISYKDYETFCPKAIAGIGKLPDTVADRSIPNRLKRARRGEVERFRKREAESEAFEIKARLAAWCAANLEKLRDARPAIPEQLSDRQADCCEPLLAIADLACGDWPEAARRALVELCCEAQADDQSVGVRLLADIRAVFAERSPDRISSADLVEALTAMETSPWAELSHGKPITKSKLAHLLGPFGVASGTIRVAGSTPKGYYLKDFEDAFSRYLPTENRNTATSPINTCQSNDSDNATGALCGSSQNAPKPNGNAGCGDVAVPRAGVRGRKPGTERMD